jgi:hypothetical protein
MTKKYAYIALICTIIPIGIEATWLGIANKFPKGNNSEIFAELGMSLGAHSQGRWKQTIQPGEKYPLATIFNINLYTIKSYAGPFQAKLYSVDWAKRKTYLDTLTSKQDTQDNRLHTIQFTRKFYGGVPCQTANWEAGEGQEICEGAVWEITVCPISAETCEW